MRYRLLFFCLVFQFCSTKKSLNSSPDNPKNTSAQVESGYSVGNTETGTDSSSSAPLNEATVAPKKPVFGVWIDGAGFDSLMALGVLQEFEKLGLKPRKIVGTGFACFVAVSWSLNNSGNQAEWQTFKWKNWDLLKKQGLLSRLGGSKAVEKTEAEVSKLFPGQTFGDFQLPADCPLIPKSPPYSFQSGRFLSLSRVLANQLFMPFVEIETQMSEDVPWYSGAFGGIPTNKELDDSAKEIISKLQENELWVGWVVLKTRNFSDFGSDFKPLQDIHAFRADEKALDSQPVGAKIFDLRKESQTFLQVKGVLGLDDRRAWLLEGRRQAPFIIERIKTDGFLKTDLH
jgi:hypothetical protein